MRVGKAYRLGSPAGIFWALLAVLFALAAGHTRALAAGAAAARGVGAPLEQDAGADPESDDATAKAENKAGKKSGKKSDKKSDKKSSKKAVKEGTEDPAAAPADATASNGQENAGKSVAGLRFSFKNYPSLRFGKLVRVDFHVKAQNDFRSYDPELVTQEGFYDLHRARVGISGYVTRHVEYEIERELRDYFRGLYEEIDEERRTEDPWRDVFVNFRYFRNFQIQVGQFKVPFGYEQTTGESKLDFVYRSRISEFIAPGRDKGIMAHGRFFERGLNYEFGYFREDGEQARTRDNQGSGRRAFAGRVTGRPFRLLPLPGPLKEFEFGGAFVHSELPELQGSLRGRTVAQQTFFDRRFVRGNRLRLGAEAVWTPGPFGFHGEFMHARDERLGQSIQGRDLPDLISRGWYADASWVVTGEHKRGGVVPRHELLSGWGFGAVELAARYEQLRFGSGEHPGLPSRSIRGANIYGNSDRAWTFGVNWYMNRWIKVQGDFIRERIEDAQRVPLPGFTLYWSHVCRVQFDF
jgi:phosphate-selective porin OprO/OprP